MSLPPKQNHFQVDQRGCRYSWWGGSEVHFLVEFMVKNTYLPFINLESSWEAPGKLLVSLLAMNYHIKYIKNTLSHQLGQNVIPKMTIPFLHTWITAAQPAWSYQQVPGHLNSFVALCSVPQAVTSSLDFSSIYSTK